MFGLQESHGEEHELGLDDLWLAFLDHDGATTLWIGLPVNLLHLDASEFAVFAYELEGVDIPTTRASFLMT